MRVGVLQGMPWVAGGGFQYEMTLLEALSEIASDVPHELVCMASGPTAFQDLVRTGRMAFGNLPLVPMDGGNTPFHQGPVEAYIAQGRPQPLPALDPNTIYINRGMAEVFRRAGADWVFMLQPGMTGFSTLTPFVMPIHDLQHRQQPEFPEVSEDGQIPYRDHLVINACRYATLILVESEHGKEDLLELYGQFITPDRIRVLPLFPPNRQGGRQADEADVRRVEAAYRLPECYFFYPAQFWRHKNHHLIVEALRRILDETGRRIEVVFCGTYADYVRAVNFQDVMAHAEALGVRGQIHYIGYAPDEDMPALYHRSVGLVMPTFFGPTNIPVLEAWRYGRPVISSDMRGIRDQIGDGGLLADPRSPEQLARAMLRLWDDEALCRDLAERGRRRLETYRWTEYVALVRDIVLDASARVLDGRSPRYPGR